MDFSQLESGREVEDDLEFDAMKRTFETRLKELHFELEQMQPNMKATERYAEVKLKVKKADAELEAARKAAVAAVDAFEDVKERRFVCCRHRCGCGMVCVAVLQCGYVAVLLCGCGCAVVWLCGCGCVAVLLLLLCVCVCGCACAAVCACECSCLYCDAYRSACHSLEMFRAAFNHVKDAVEDVYKAMTRSSPAGHGGTAALQLDNELEPFECAWCSRVSAWYLPLTCVAVPSAGVRYTAIPPAKKFREMALMSSGEKAVATLALLFAIHRYGLHYDTAVHGCAWLCLALTHAALWFVCSYKRAPFFILDEIDANLDKFNVQKVVNYVRTRTAPTDDHPDNAEVQCLVISLKVCLR